MAFLNTEFYKDAEGNWQLKQLPPDKDPLFWFTVKGPEKHSILAANEPGEIKKHRIVVTEISGWPEFANKDVERCIEYRIEVPFVGEVKDNKCAIVGIPHQRSCKKYLYIDVFYPASIWNDVNECLKGAAIIGAVTAYNATPTIGVATFKATLKTCLKLKGTQWIELIDVKGGEDSECGDWHPF